MPLQGDPLRRSMPSQTSSSWTTQMFQSSASTSPYLRSWKPSSSALVSSSTVLAHSLSTAPLSFGTCARRHGRDSTQRSYCSACARTATHYTDITGEAHWILKMIKEYFLISAFLQVPIPDPRSRYDYLASKNKAIIIPASGMDSVPRYAEALLPAHYSLLLEVHV